MTSSDNMIKDSCDFMDGSLLQFFTTLSCLVTIDILIVVLTFDIDNYSRDLT